MDPLKTEVDRYHKVNTQITKVDNNLKKLQSRQEHIVGKNWLDNLTSQWNELNTQISNYNEKLRIANEEQNELASSLANKGVQFNADGTIANYGESIKAQEAYVNSLINKYNSMSKAKQETYKETVENAKKEFEEFQKNIDRYDELVSDFIPNLKQSIQDAIDKQIDISVQEFNKEVEITLDMSQATRD
jgi:N-acetylglucosamine-6-phosphate deacetylase